MSKHKLIHLKPKVDTDLDLEIIESMECKLKIYKEALAENPNSVFYQGLVKNTQEYINELKGI